MWLPYGCLLNFKLIKLPNNGKYVHLSYINLFLSTVLNKEITNIGTSSCIYIYGCISVYISVCVCLRQFPSCFLRSLNAWILGFCCDSLVTSLLLYVQLQYEKNDFYHPIKFIIYSILRKVMRVNLIIEYENLSLKYLSKVLK